MHFVFYKLKDIENIKEILQIAKSLNLKVIIIPREDVDIDYKQLSSIYKFEVMNFNMFFNKFKDKKIAFIETYGNKFVNEVYLGQFEALVFGSEDFGIDLCDIKKFDQKEVLKIPILKDSYNVVSSFVMVLTELHIQNIL